MHYKHEIPSKNASSVKPVSLYLQTRPFAPPTTEEEEPQMRSRSTESAADFSHLSGIYPTLLNTSPSHPANTSIDNPSLQRKETDGENKATAFKDKLRAKITNPLPMPRENRGGSLLKKPIQAKLNIGEPDDKYKKEADATAERVVQQINSPLQEQSVQRQELMEEEDELQMKSLIQRRENIGGGVASTDLESSIQSARGRGQALDPNLQVKMGEAMGADFSGVKVHTDSQSDQLNQSIQAKAFTTGQDVFFRQGAYQPSSRGGQELIAHELTHVVQQNGGTVSSTSAFPQHPPIIKEPKSVLSDEKIDHQPNSTFVQRAIYIDGKEYSQADEGDFLKDYADEIIEIENALRNSGSSIQKRDILSVLSDPRRIEIERDYSDFEENGKIYYDAFTQEAEVLTKGNMRTREAGRIPEMIKRPEEGVEQLKISGLISCIAVVIEVVDESGIIGASGGHFVTPEMYYGGNLTQEGEEFVDKILQLSKTIGGSEGYFLLYYSGEADHKTEKSLDLLRDRLEEGGAQFGEKVQVGGEILYRLDQYGQSNVK